MPSRRRPALHSAPAGPLCRLVAAYGWRAYAVPVLSVLTVLALVRNTPDRRPAGGSRTTPGALAGARLTTGTERYGPGATPAPLVVTLPDDDATSCAANTLSRLIVVSIRHQHMWVCEGRREVNESPITTGKSVDHDQTPVGSWRVQAKQRDRYLAGPGYRDHVQYWVPFNGDFGLHDAPWQTMPFGSADYPVHGSHGCVHVPTTVMAWLYRWTVVHETVVSVNG